MSRHSLKSCSSMLKENGIKPSFQRVKIMEFLQNNNIHPTVNDIYEALIDEIPSLSKTTVYNTLNLMREHSLVNMLTIDDLETRYDLNLGTHGHFFCTKCKKIMDIQLNLDNVISHDIDDHYVDSIDVQVNGICPDCKKKKFQ